LQPSEDKLFQVEASLLPKDNEVFIRNKIQNQIIVQMNSSLDLYRIGVRKEKMMIDEKGVDFSAIQASIKFTMLFLPNLTTIRRLAKSINRGLRPVANQSLAVLFCCLISSSYACIGP
jgi:hypothetical protein